MGRIFNMVFLVGYMGSGKSFLGRLLADKLDFDFVDTDDYIEKMSGKSISSIFSEQGEDYFRKLETKAITKLSDIPNLVVATGGGLPCYGNNMQLLRENGVVIFLDATPNVLMMRLVSEKSKRPLLADLEGNDTILNFITTHLQERLSYYNDAHLSITIENNDLDFINPLVDYLKKVLKF